jgi:hypothetical protein
VRPKSLASGDFVEPEDLPRFRQNSGKDQVHTLTPLPHKIPRIAHCPCRTVLGSHMQVQQRSIAVAAISSLLVS